MREKREGEIRAMRDAIEIRAKCERERREGEISANGTEMSEREEREK